MSPRQLSREALKRSGANREYGGDGTQEYYLIGRCTEGTYTARITHCDTVATCITGYIR